MLTVNVEAEFDLPLVQEATDLLARAVAMSPDKPRYRQAYAEALVAARRNEEALEQLNYLHSIERRARTSYLLAVVLHRLGRLDQAHAFLDEAQEEGTIGFAKLHVLRGRLFEAENRTAEAANQFGEAMLLNPNSREARWRRARSMVALAQERDDAASLYRRAFQLLRDHHPGALDEDEYHYLLGRIHLALLQPVEALRHLERSRHPSENDKQLLVGLAFLLGGDAAGARASLAAAARAPECRSRVESYLIELATAPVESLGRLSGHRDPSANTRLAADLDTLVAIFGPQAPEVERIREAARQGRRPDAIRTLVEADRLSVGGRLIASFDDPTVPETTSSTESTVVSGAAPGERTTRKSELPTGQLFPQTQVDVTEVLPITEGIENVDPNDDRPVAPGSEGRTDATRRIDADSFPDFDEVPDLDFGEIEDESPER